MAGQWGTGGSRAGSLSLEGAPLMAGHQSGATDTDHVSTTGQNHHLQLPHQHEESSLLTLARRNTRNRSLRHKKVMELQDVNVNMSRHPSMDSLVDQQHLHPSGYGNSHRRSPSLRRAGSPSLQRSPSPRRRHPQHLHHDIGFSDTVSNVVEIVKHEHQRHHSHRHRIRAVAGINSTAPHTAAGPLACGVLGAVPMGPMLGPNRPSAASSGMVQHSHPVLVGRRGQGRRLPPTPCKPSTLQLRPQPINFPKLNASPTHMQAHTTHNTPHGHHQQLAFERDHIRAGDSISLPQRASSREILREASLAAGRGDATTTMPAGGIVQPLSFEQAVAMGRGGRVLPSPVPNGYKPKPTGGRSARHSDSDDDDWC